MATPQYSPLPAEIAEMVTYEEASALLHRTGHPASVTTVRRWVRNAGKETVRHRGVVYVSYSDVLQLHAAHVGVRLRASSDWP